MINKDNLIRAIQAQDANYIKNMYFYHKDEYLGLCNQLEIIKAFHEAQNYSTTHFNDSILDFWRTIHYVNEEQSKISKDDQAIVNINPLPTYFIEIIDKVNDMRDTHLQNHTPLWMTPKNLGILTLVTSCMGVTGYSVYKMGVHFCVREACSDYFKLVVTRLHETWVDPTKYAIRNYAIAACTSLGLLTILVTSNYITEAKVNLFDWSEYKYRTLVGKKETEIAIL